MGTIPRNARSPGACAKPSVRRSSPQSAVPPNTFVPTTLVTPAQMSQPLKALNTLAIIPCDPSPAAPMAPETATRNTTMAAWPVAFRSASTDS